MQLVLPFGGWMVMKDAQFSYYRRGFGAALAGLLYRPTDNYLAAVLGEIVGTGIISAIVSAPIMTWLYHVKVPHFYFYIPFFCQHRFLVPTSLFVFKAGGHKNFVIIDWRIKNMKLSTLKTTPLVFNYANYVTPQFVANAVNVIDGSPIMARSGRVFDLVAVSVVVNTGTWRRAERRDSKADTNCQSNKDSSGFGSCCVVYRLEAFLFKSCSQIVKLILFVVMLEIAWFGIDCQSWY